MKDNKLKIITYVALFSAFVLVSSKIEFRIFETRFHLGNSMCLLAGLVLGSVNGGLSAGIGSFFFDILFYPSSMPFSFLITFITKFAMGYFCGLVYKHKISNNELLNTVAAGFIGQAVYIILYMVKTYFESKFIKGLPNDAVILALMTKFSISSINAIIAIIISCIIFNALKKYLHKLIF